MSTPPEAPLPLGTQLAADMLASPSTIKTRILEAGEHDLGPAGLPTQALTDAWLQAYWRFVEAYMIPLLDPPDEVWIPPRTHLSLLEAATIIVLRLKDSRHFFTPERRNARKVIPALLVFYVLLDGYDASSDPAYDARTVSSAQMQELIFEALVMYLLSLGDRIKPRGDKEPVEALAEDDPVLSTTLHAFLNACDGTSRPVRTGTSMLTRVIEILLKRETLLYPCTVPILVPGRIYTRLDDEVSPRMERPLFNGLIEYRSRYRWIMFFCVANARPRYFLHSSPLLLQRYWRPSSILPTSCWQPIVSALRVASALRLTLWFPDVGPLLLQRRPTILCLC